MALNFRTLDDIKTDLEAKHPGWRVWFVPGVGHTTWCAQKIPQLAETSPEDLSKAIDETETDWRDDMARDVWRNVWGEGGQGCSV